MTTLSIRQLTGSRREVVLTDDTMPDRGAASAVRQRHTLSWMPYAVEPVLQVLGPELVPQEFEGMLDAADGLDVDAVSADLERIGAEGVLVELAWDTRWQRLGLVTEVTIEPQEPGLARWQLTFQPISSEISPGQPSQPSPRAEGRTAAQDGDAIAAAGRKRQVDAAGATWLERVS